LIAAVTAIGALRLTNVPGSDVIGVIVGVFAAIHYLLVTKVPGGEC
jgi:hypothetical protein